MTTRHNKIMAMNKMKTYPSIDKTHGTEGSIAGLNKNYKIIEKLELKLFDGNVPHAIAHNFYFC